MRIIEAVIVRFDQTGQKKPLLGNQMEEDVPRNVYPTADQGGIALSCGSQQIFNNLADAMGRPDLKSDPRFATMSDRVRNRDAIDAEVAAWMAIHETDDALATLLEHKVVAGRVNDIEDVLNDAHVAARSAVEKVFDADLGSLRMPAPVPKLSDTPGSIRWTGQAPGAANEEVFGEMAGPVPRRTSMRCGATKSSEMSS